jgi:predicted lipoprotein with Yx(FWY)xxD motif
LTSPFVGSYLADSSGRTLYTYGGDMPGSCSADPVSLCERDCLIAWPLFEGRPRVLAPSLNDGVFGTIQRADGNYQATYHGWPLYYYKPDTAAGMLTGQGKAKTWFVATVIPPSVVIMKSTTAQKYLADGAGRTLYTFAQDTKGTTSSDPVAACTGTCLETYRPFRKNRLSFVSPLEPTDFSIFVGTGGSGQQVAYRGAPLYFATADVRSGDTNGVAAPDWAVVAQ